jgi:hypothetical protein
MLSNFIQKVKIPKSEVSETKTHLICVSTVERLINVYVSETHNYKDA